MSKAILVVDVDDKYLDKEVSLIKFTDGNAICCSEKLKPVPKQLDPGISDEYVNYCQGFNDCIDEILGEEE